MSEATLALRRNSAFGALVRFLDYTYEGIRLLAKPTAFLFHKLGIKANQVTMSRLVCSPITFYLLYSFERTATEYLIAVLFWGYSDAVDGAMSKDFERKSNDDKGVMLDSGADKCMTISMYGYHYGNFPNIVFITIASELLLAILSIGSVAYAALFGQDAQQVIGKMKSTYWGKFKLGLEIASAVLMAWYAQTYSPKIQIAIYTTAITAIFLLIMSLLTKVKKVLG